MALCPYCKGELTLDNIKLETKGMGFLKQEVMYVCPHCDCVVGIGRGKYT